MATIWRSTEQTVTRDDSTGAESITWADPNRAAREAARATVRQVIDDLHAEKTRTQAIIDATNATINAAPAAYIKDGARAAKRIADAAIDLARFVKDV